MSSHKTDFETGRPKGHCLAIKALPELPGETEARRYCSGFEKKHY